MRVDSIETPLGTLHIALRGEAVAALRFEHAFVGEPARSTAASKLRAYFAGDVRAIEFVEIEPAGTDFQKKVWSALRGIPPGETISYRDLARTIESHARAVGSANARNPIALVIPCHRVVASDGALCGYAWGLERKLWLLRHERASLLAHGRLPVAG